MRVGFDVGGTFTDVVYIDEDGELRTVKLLSLLDQIGSDIRQLLGSASEGAAFVHGTTLCSNALIEGNVARAGFITTRGFRDVLEMRNQRRPNVSDVNWDRLPQLVRRFLRLEIDERILGDGTIDRPLNKDEVREVIEQLVRQGVEAIAVCLINSYLNPTHEEQVHEIAQSVAPDIPVCISSMTFSEIGEYARASTTCINASLIPVVDRYLTRLEHQLSAVGERLLIMQSSGGLANSMSVRQVPVFIIESGPAAGVLAGAKLASEMNLDRVLCFDMGGTSAKASTVLKGRPLEKPESEIGAAVTLASRFFGGDGHVVRVPSLDIVEVGAGGGSVAWIDGGGNLRVGPEGAGAHPGPVSYGRGGQRPTVTDANVVLGYINPVSIAGSMIEIDREAASRAIHEQLARPLGMTVTEAAYGVIQIANAVMMRALRAVSIEKGQDPRQLTMMAYGGSGPIHAASLASTLGIRWVCIPPVPGLFSALGLLLADYRHDTVRTMAIGIDAADGILFTYDELERDAKRALVRQGIDPDSIDFHRKIDMQYRHQGSPLTLAFPSVRLESDLPWALRNLFRTEHQAMYGYNREDAIDVVSIRVQAIAPAAAVDMVDVARLRESEASSGHAGRIAFFGPRFGEQETQVLGRNEVSKDSVGPLIIEESDTSIVVPPGWRVQADRFGNVLLTYPHDMPDSTRAE